MIRLPEDAVAQPWILCDGNLQLLSFSISGHLSPPKTGERLLVKADEPVVRQVDGAHGM